MTPSASCVPLAAPAAVRSRPSLALLAISGLFLLLLFGPSNLRFGTRPADAALQGQLDIFALIDAASWLIGGGLVCLTMIHAVLPRLLGASGALLWALFFAGFALASTLWSMLPAYTAFFALKAPLFIGVALALAARARQEGRDPIAWLLLCLFIEHAATLGLIAVLYVVNPDAVLAFNTFEGGYRLTGGWLGDYGRSASLTCLLAAWWLVRERRSPHAYAFLVALLAFAAVFLVLSRTRTTMGHTAIGLLVIAFVARGALLRWGWLLAVAAAAIWLIGDPAVASYINRNQRAEDIASFSGRADAFSYLVTAWHEAPLVGYGHAAGVRSWMVRYMNETGIELGGAHDALSCVLIDLGLVGAVILGIGLLVGFARTLPPWWRALHGGSQRWRADTAMCAALLMKVVVQCFANGSLAAGSLYWLLLVVLLDEMRRRPADPAPPTQATPT